MVPFSSCLLSLSSLSPVVPSLFHSRHFSRIFGCVFIYFFSSVLAKPTKELAITSAVKNSLPAFQYTHRLTFAHSPTYTFTQFTIFITQCKQTKTNYTAHKLSYDLTSRQGGLQMFETASECLISWGEDSDEPQAAFQI